MSAPRLTIMRTTAALIALGACLFVVVTAETLVIGLLPALSADLRVPVPSAGLLVAGYALTVTIGGPLVTAATLRVPRKAALLGLVAVFAAGNALAASATGFGVLLAARVVTALTHSTFFAIALVLAATMVHPSKRGWAIAFVSTGLNLATVLGAPLGTLVGEAYGWRTSFWLLAVVALAAMAAVALLVPATRTAEPPRLGPELRALVTRPVLVLLAVTLVAETGFFVAYTYLSPILGRIFPPGGVVVLLMVFGAGALCGNLAGGRLADRWPWASLRVLIVVLAAALVLFAAIASARAGAVVGVFALGAVAFALVPGLQTRVVVAAAGAPTLAVAVYTSIFNLGISAGAWLGGRALSAGVALGVLPLLGAAGVLGGLAVSALHRGGGLQSGRRSPATRRPTRRRAS